MKDIRLYIADTLVDLDSESVITMNYTLEDTNNPTIVKNSFSKSISLPATDNNNKLFGHIYNLSRKTIIADTKYSGAYFNSLRRTPFQLFIDGELKESGYIQLTSIATKNDMPRYTIQVYGGLGDFLYTLMYDENGDKRNLASLTYGFEGYTGDAKDEMSFTISNSVVAETWRHLPRSGRNTLAETITFVPAYNGVGKDFDAKHAVIDSNALSQMGMPRTLPHNGKTYSSINGYGLLEFPRNMDEAEVRDLRSYMQRPAISVKSIFDACANPKNNGGYSVVLDSAFFNEENPCYWDAYITLPLLSTEKKRNGISVDLKGKVGIIGGADNSFGLEIDLGIVNVTSEASNATVKVNVPISLYIENSSYDELHCETEVYTLSGGVASRQYSIRSAIVAQVVAYNSRGTIIEASQEMAFSDGGTFNRNWDVYEPLDRTDRGVINNRGYFKRERSELVFTSADNHNTYPIEMSLVRGSNDYIRFALRVQRAYFSSNLISTDASALFKGIKSYINDGESLSAIVVGRNSISISPFDSTCVTEQGNLPSISTGSRVTKDILLGETDSPADYLLSYIKLFNLRLVKDTISKEITITPNYFTGEVVNLDGRVNKGQDVTITPTIVNRKFVRFALRQPDTYFASKYRDTHKVDYGQKRVDTGYGFNNDTEEIYKDNIFTSAIPCLATSKLFNTFYNSSGTQIANAIADNPKLIYASGSPTTGYDTYGEELVSADYIDVSKTIPYNRVAGYDIMPRMCYFDNKDEERESVDISNNLVIYNYDKPLVDSNSRRISYWLTDDIPEMISLNGKNCYLITAEGGDEAIEYTSLPLFLSVKLSSDGKRVKDSLDFAKSKEIYIPQLDYADGISIYDRYWASMYNDRLDVDTAKVVCYVDLSGLIINNEALRKFYFFDNNYWLLNKINDYDPAKEKLVKCEFIKVHNLNNYYTSTSEGDLATITDMDII